MKKTEPNENDQVFEFNNQKIQNVVMESEVKTSFIQYAMSVIMQRALPDVRDGLKPVHRRILYAMYEDHMTYDKETYKSATTVGNVLGRYHPHGDSSVYDAMVRLAQDFSMRYPLIDGQGNFGNVDGDQAAAYRYTEAKLSRISNDMLADIEKNTIDFTPNFDNKRQEPTVLPSRFPNILVNGSVGIAVGMATNIPPHNLGEVIDGTIYLMDHPDAKVEDLMQYIKGPDFPTAAIIQGTSGIIESYATGKGKIIVRARGEIDESKRRIVFTEIPYMVNKANLVESIADCVKEKKIDGITELRDETGRDGMRIVIEYRRDANGQVIMNQLYKYTQLQDTCGVNMLALVDNVPKVLPLKTILELYIKHQDEVVRRRVQFDLDKALREAHIYEGYKIAADNIEEVIRIIRFSDSIPDAKAKLMATYGLSEIQAQAIVDMTLGRLSGMERQKVIDHIAELTAKINEYQAILADDGKVYQIIKDEMLDIKKRFGDARRTEIVPIDDDIVVEDLIERHTCIVTMSHEGYIKRIPSDTYKSQGRGGKGVVGMATKEEDFVEFMMAADSHSYLMMFSNLGRVYVKKAYMLPEAGRTAKGSNIVNVLELSEGEKITAMICLSDFPENEYLTMITKQGVIKRTSLAEFAIQRKGGKIALTLNEGDELLFVEHTFGGGELMIATKSGLAIRFREDDVRVMGRSAAGVRGIKLVREDDAVVGAAVVTDDKSLLVVTEQGYGKRVDFDKFSVHGRGGQGMKLADTERTGDIAGIAAVEDEQDLMLIADDGNMIRTPVEGISVQGREAGGVRIMRPDDGAKVVSLTVLPKEKEIEEESAEKEKAAEAENAQYTEAVEVTDESNAEEAEESDNEEV